jgi:hypothetical protein
VLDKQVLSLVDAALADIEKKGPFNEHIWPDVFVEIIRPLIQNMRDARRYAAAVRGTVTALDGQVALADVLALEAVRVFLPDVFTQMNGVVDGLTTTAAGLGADTRAGSEELKPQIDLLVRSGGAQGELVRAIIRRLFPGAQRHIGGSTYGAEWMNTWIKERRVAHGDIFRFYLERVVGEGLWSFNAAEKAWEIFGDREALDSYMRSLDMDELQDVIGSLEAYEKEFKPEHVVPASIVLFNLAAILPERRRNMFELGTRFVVGRVTFRLLNLLKDPATIETAVRQILPELTSLSSKLQLITQVRHRENAGHRLISEATAREIEAAWRNEFRASSVDQLVLERDVGAVFLTAKRESGATELALQIDGSPGLTLLLLRSAQGEQLSQAIGSRSVRRAFMLDWAALIELYGDETVLGERIKELKASGCTDDVLALAEKYLSGWRPDRRP